MKNKIINCEKEDINCSYPECDCKQLKYELKDYPDLNEKCDEDCTKGFTQEPECISVSAFEIMQKLQIEYNYTMLKLNNLVGVTYKPFVKDESSDLDKNLFIRLLDEFDNENLKDNFVLTKTGGEITELKDVFYQPKKKVEIKLKDPKECEYFKEVGCIKDICTCYTLLDK